MMTKTLVDVFCKNTGKHLAVPGGTTLLEAYALVAGEVPVKPICAIVNNEVCSLHSPIFSPQMVEFVDCTTRHGERVYMLSLCMMMYKAVHDVLPGARVRMEYGVSNGIYCQLFGIENPDYAAIAALLKEQMGKLAAADIPFLPHEELTCDVVEKLKAQGLTDKAQLLQTTQSLYTRYFTLDNLIDIYYSDLAASTACVKVFDIHPYKDGLLLLPCNVKQPEVPYVVRNEEKVFAAYEEYETLNQIVGIKNVGELNKAVENRRDIRMLITVAEAVHERKFATIAGEIANRRKNGGAKVVLLAGPSSSGKTTSSKRLSVQLMANMVVPKVISLDNYFVDRVNTPLDENGEQDFESLYSLDLEQFNTDLNLLLQGKEVAMPTYNFEMGKREYRGDTLKLDDNNVLLLEGIHGLNPELTASIPADQKFLMFASALSTINFDDHNYLSPSDNRLLRRLIRDFKYRGTSAQESIARWPSVRRGEKKWIEPFQENADAVFNSSLIFELGVMRSYGEEILRNVPRNVPEYAEAARLLKLLSFFSPICGSNVPGNSLLREFLGGSMFHY